MRRDPLRPDADDKTKRALAMLRTARPELRTEHLREDEAPLKTLEQTLPRIVQSEPQLRLSEAATCLGAVLPVLSELGWDPHDVGEMTPEYTVGSRRVDYCLRTPHRNLMFVEAKRAGEALGGHETQLLEYAFAEGVELAVLTNGIEWWLYLATASGPWEQRKFFTIDISQQSVETASLTFRTFLAKDAVLSGKALADATAVRQDRQREQRVRAALPEAWTRMLTEPDELLVELLAERVEKISGHTPHPDSVAEFLSATELRGRSAAAAPATQPQHRTARTPPAVTSPGTVTHRAASSGYTHRRCRGYQWKGIHYPAARFKEVHGGVSVLLWREYPEDFHRVLALHGSKRPYFSRNRDELWQPEPVAESGVFVETHLNANQTVAHAREILALFGEDAASLVVETEA